MLFNNKFKGVFGIKINKTDELQIKNKNRLIDIEFKKQTHHFQAEFENIGTNPNIFKTYLSCNTTKPNEGFYERIDVIDHLGKNKEQYINYKHQIIVDKISSELIQYSSSEYNLNQAKLINTLLQKSNKIPIIEQKLNVIHQNFENCIKYKTHILDCYHIINITSFKVIDGSFNTALIFTNNFM